MGPPPRFSFEPAKPDMASTFLFDSIWPATVAAFCGSSALSPIALILIFVRLKPFGIPTTGLPEFQNCVNTRDHRTWSWPSAAAGPLSIDASPSPAVLQFGVTTLLWNYSIPRLPTP